jgi:hypothetical protein
MRRVDLPIREKAKAVILTSFFNRFVKQTDVALTSMIRNVASSLNILP